MYARRTRSFFREYDPVTVLVCTNLTLLLRKSCNVHMTVFKILVHRNVDNCQWWTYERFRNTQSLQSLALCILAQTTHP